MKLPAEFLEEMRTLLDSAEYESFLQALSREKKSGLSVNTLRINPVKFKEIAPTEMESIPWCPEGLHYDGERFIPGRHPYYHAGLYYIQEPSAMLPAKALAPRPGERVLDLCAAPGGKTVQIACAMENKGLLVSNDNSAKRARALVKNIELAGIRNAVVTVEDYRRLSAKLLGFFDRILVDAPCSGEGMFRKNAAAIKCWDIYSNDRCSQLQYDMLLHADRMLKTGGRLVYSTCTYSPKENECVIARFIKDMKNYTLVEIPKSSGIEQGRPEWCGDILAPSKAGILGNAARLWPHRVNGEGHFAVALLKTDNGIAQGNTDMPEHSNEGKPAEFAAFESENLMTHIDGRFLLEGNGVYLLPEEIPDLRGIRTVKTGWYLGHIKNGKFLPSQSLVMSLKKDDIAYAVDYRADSPEIRKYLKGETIILQGRKGLMAMCVDGYPLGWARQTGTFIKNMYPASWRMLT